MAAIAIVSFTLLYSCSNTNEQTVNRESSIRYDTIDFGSYYNLPMDSAFFLSVKDGKDKELVNLTADSLYTITVSLKGKRAIPFRFISLNRNVQVSQVQSSQNQYQLKIVQQFPTIDKYYARFAILPPDTNTRYIFRNRFWIDSTKTKYQEGTMQVDTICKLTFKINNKNS